MSRRPASASLLLACALAQGQAAEQSPTPQAPTNQQAVPQTLSTPHFGPSPRQFWMEPMQGSLGFGPGEALQLRQPGLHDRELKTPQGAWTASLGNGEAWALQLAETPEHPLGTLYLWESADLQRWDAKHEVDTDHGVPQSLDPIPGGRYFLGFASLGGFADDSGASCAALFKLSDDGHLRFQSALPLEFDNSPLFRVRSTTVDGKTSRVPEIKPEFAAIAPFLSYPVLAQDGCLLVSARTGLCWWMSYASRSVSLLWNPFQVHKEDLGAASGLDTGILAAQPRQDGHILVAARTEFAVKHAAEFFSILAKENEAPQGEAAHTDAERDRALTAFRDLEWWDLDPRNGKTYQERGPGYPDHLLSYREFLRFRFSLGLDGVPLMMPRSKWSASSPQPAPAPSTPDPGPRVP